MGRGSECGRGRCSKRSWGAWVGDVARDLSVRARVRACSSTTGAGKAELTGRCHGAARERESGSVGVIVWCTDEAGPRSRGVRGRRQPAPTAQPHWAERGRERAGKGARGREAWLGRVGSAGLLWLFPFSWNFYLLFHFLFSRVFNSNSNQVSNSN
jgi:hypothetical protein